MVKQIFCSKKKFLGDSIVEVLIAVAIFSAIAVAALAIMNKGLENAQSSLETTIARTEMDTQAEKIRFIADSVNSSSEYRTKWAQMTGAALSPEDASDSPYSEFINQYKTAQLQSCEGVIKTKYNAFVLTETNEIQKRTEANSLATAIPGVEPGGLFVVAVKSPKVSNDIPEYYDFYINTCWDEPGASFPTKLSTTIRIQNPDFVTSEETTAPESFKAGSVTVIYHWYDDTFSTIRPWLKKGDCATQWHSLSDSHEPTSCTSDVNGDTVSAERLISQNNTGGLKSGNQAPRSTDIGNITLGSGGNYNNHKFTGFYYQNSDTKRTLLPDIYCEEPEPAKEGDPFNCRWRDGTPSVDGEGKLHLYAHWEEIPKTPVWFYCIKYSSTGAGIASGYGSSGVTGTVYPTCHKDTSNSGAKNVYSSGNLGYSAGDNFSQYAWRNGARNWNGYDPTNYQNTKFIVYGNKYVSVPSGTKDSSITTSTEYIKDDDQSSGRRTIGSQIAANEEFAGAYSVTLYPHWRAIIKVAADTEQTKTVSHWFSPDTIEHDFWYCQDHKQGCSMVADLRYNKQEYETNCNRYGYLCDKPIKYLESYLKFGNNKVYCHDRGDKSNNTCEGHTGYSSTPDYYTKIERYDDIGARKAKTFLIFDHGEYSDKRIYMEDNNTAISEITINPGTLTNNFYYTIFSDLKTGYDSRSYISTSDTVQLDFLLNGDAHNVATSSRHIDITPDNSDNICWPVFKFSPTSGSLYINRTPVGSYGGYTLNNNNNCVDRTGGIFDNIIPF